MSDSVNLLYNEVIGYHKDLWKEISSHNLFEIKGFFGEYRWLSNFHLCPVFYQGITYPSAENAYQAAKVAFNCREHFVNMTPSQSKKNWDKFPLLISDPEEWDSTKNLVMTEIITDKFTRNLDLFHNLMETGDKYIEETNWWGDRWWGVDYKTGEGQNHLGRIIMGIRFDFS